MKMRLLLVIAALSLAGAASAETRMCPMIYQPVCALTRAGHLKTYPNRCMAEVAHARVRHAGECRPRHR